MREHDWCYRCGVATTKHCRCCLEPSCDSCSFDSDDYDPLFVPPKINDYDTVCIDCNPNECAGCNYKINGVTHTKCCRCGVYAHYHCTAPGTYRGERICSSCSEECICCCLTFSDADILSCESCLAFVCRSCAADLLDKPFCVPCVRDSLPAGWKLGKR